MGVPLEAAVAWREAGFILIAYEDWSGDAYEDWSGD